jgi:hypothetical protein
MKGSPPNWVWCSPYSFSLHSVPKKGKENLVNKTGRKGEKQGNLDSPPPVKKGRKPKKAK